MDNGNKCEWVLVSSQLGYLIQHHSKMSWVLVLVKKLHFNLNGNPQTLFKIQEKIGKK